MNADNLPKTGEGSTPQPVTLPAMPKTISSGKAPGLKHMGIRILCIAAYVYLLNGDLTSAHWSCVRGRHLVAHVGGGALASYSPRAVHHHLLATKHVQMLVHPLRERAGGAPQPKPRLRSCAALNGHKRESPAQLYSLFEINLPDLGEVSIFPRGQNVVNYVGMHPASNRTKRITHLPTESPACDTSGKRDTRNNSIGS